MRSMSGPWDSQNLETCPVTISTWEPQFQLSLEVQENRYGDDVSAVRLDAALAKSRRGTFEWVASHFTEKCSDDQNGESVE